MSLLLSRSRQLKEPEKPSSSTGRSHRSTGAYKALSVVSIIALLLQTSLLFLSLFEKPLPYAIGDPGSRELISREFKETLASLTGGNWSSGNQTDVLTNGEAFYTAELESIRGARNFVHIECYVFQAGAITDRLIGALEERAKAGVRVRMVVDAIGSASFPKSRFAKLEAAGGKVGWYHPIRWYTWPRINNRTHREIVIVDGTTAFVGGAGFSDQWMFEKDGHRRWRDTMLRIRGPAAAGLQGVFAENWLESTGELLMNSDYFPNSPGPGQAEAMVVMSSPSRGRSTEARILVQALIAKATQTIHATTPYFLPDESLREELAKAKRERGVEVKILTPGKKSDHLLTRSSSRQLYGDLLLSGAEIYEYQPSMIHAKILLIDRTWAVVGSTNLDYRSFGINDEINVAFPNREVAARLEADFQNDLKNAARISYEEWNHRPLWEKLTEWFGWLLQNQQ